MGDDYKMNQEGKNKEVQLFLEKEIFTGERKKQIYSLGEEFAKTKKNNRPGFYIAILAVILFIAGVTLAITYYLQNQNRKIGINIEDFQDLKLSELLDASKKYEKELEQTKTEIYELKLSLQKEIARIKENTEKEKQLIDTLNISGKEKERRLQERKEKEEIEIRQIQNTHNQKLALKEKELKELQSRVDAYDQKLVTSAKKSEDVINNYQKIHDLKMEEQQRLYEDKIKGMEISRKKEIAILKEHQKKYYELLILRYNPIFESEEINDILKNPVDKNAIYPDKQETESFFLKEKSAQQEELNALQSKIAKYSLILSKLNEIPYINSVKPSLEQLGYLSKTIAGDYQKLLLKMIQTVKQRDSIINTYSKAFDFYSSQITRENGYVIGGDSEKLIIALNNKYKVKNGAKALVFRKEKEQIGIIRLYNENYGVRGEIESLQQGRPQAFDKILIIEN